VSFVIANPDINKIVNNKIENNSLLRASLHLSDRPGINIAELMRRVLFAKE
jgi:hypothetical protein